MLHVNCVNSVNSANSYSAVLPPSPMVFLFIGWDQFHNTLYFYDLFLILLHFLSISSLDNIMVPFWDYVTFMNCEKRFIFTRSCRSSRRGCWRRWSSAVKKMLVQLEKFFSQVHLYVQIVAKKKRKERAKQALYATLFKLV